MEQDPSAGAAPTATTTATAAETPPAASADRADTLAEALGTDGPGIAAEIEAELSASSTDTPSENTPPIEETAPPEAPAVAGAGIDLGILNDVHVTLTARLCATSQPLGAVLSMKPGTIVDLGRETNGPIELLANGVVVAYGEVVAVGSSLGVRITALAH